MSDAAIPLTAQWATLDWLVLVLVLASMMLGGWRGLVYEVLSLLGWAVSGFMAYWFAADAAAMLPAAGLTETMRYIAGLVLVFVISMFACGLVAWFAKRLVESVGLRPVDRVLGAVFGVVRAGLIVGVVGVFVHVTAIADEGWWKESFFGPRIDALVKDLGPILPQKFEQLLPV